ncbi:hypothetical protein HanRHA438_Chr03g0146791 [Helianthus annuus]|nr:hypothetical protein HanRHA438_Chr03g0146791 [Helianthus annuus]
MYFGRSPHPESRRGASSELNRIPHTSSVYFSAVQIVIVFFFHYFVYYQFNLK